MKAMILSNLFRYPRRLEILELEEALILVLPAQREKLHMTIALSQLLMAVVLRELTPHWLKVFPTMMF